MHAIRTLVALSAAVLATACASVGSTPAERQDMMADRMPPASMGK